MWDWITGIAWKAVAKRIAPYFLAIVVAAWAASLFWAFDQGKTIGSAEQELAWAEAYRSAVKSWHQVNAELAAAGADAARAIEEARQEKEIQVKEVIRYVDRIRVERPELDVCVIDDDFMQLRRAQLARTRDAGPD